MALANYCLKFQEADTEPFLINQNFLVIEVYELPE